jgi:uncharacterized membrane protein
METKRGKKARKLHWSAVAMIPILAFDRYLDLQITTATFASDCSSELTCFKSPFASMRSSTAVNWIACLMSLSRSGNEDVASAASQYFSIDLISCGFALRNAARVVSTAASCEENPAVAADTAMTDANPITPARYRMPHTVHSPPRQTSVKNNSCSMARWRLFLLERRKALQGNHGGQRRTIVRTRATPERLSTFSDGVFAVLITVLVLELRPPEQPTFQALMLLWPTWLSYAVSYVFIAIVWANHHHLMRYATEATPRLMWFNFAHLFSVSLLPLSTAWMAVSELAPQPVAFYAAVFFLVNATYIFLIRELVDRAPADEVPRNVRRIMHIRSVVTLCLFGVAIFAALKFPVVGLGICCCCLIVYLKPEAPGAR